MNKKWLVVIGIVALMVAVSMTGLLRTPTQEQKLDKVIEVQLGQPIIIDLAAQEVQLLSKLPYTEAVPGVNPDEGKQSIMLWNYCVLDIENMETGYIDTADFIEGRVKEFKDYPMHEGIEIFSAIRYERCWFNVSDNYVHRLFAAGYHQEGEKKRYNDLEITWEDTQIRTIGNESVITIKLRITQV